jgi:hypothetical protein
MFTVESSGLTVGDHVLYINQFNVQNIRSLKDSMSRISSSLENTREVLLVTVTHTAYRVLQKRGGRLDPRRFSYRSMLRNVMNLRLCELSLNTHTQNFGLSINPLDLTHIEQVEIGSVAERNQIERDDHILELNGKNVSKLFPNQISQIFQDSREQRLLTLLVIDKAGYEYSIRHGIPLHSRLPFLNRIRQTTN